MDLMPLCPSSTVVRYFVTDTCPLTVQPLEVVYKHQQSQLGPTRFRQNGSGGKKRLLENVSAEARDIELDELEFSFLEVETSTDFERTSCHPCWALALIW